jgi:hypothetical protein
LQTDTVSIPLLNRQDELKVQNGLKRLVRYLTNGQSWNIRAIILTGSLPSGWGRPPASDLDVIVITRIYDISFNHRIRAALQSTELPCRFEVTQSPSVIFTRMQSVSRYDMRETGRLVYGDRRVLESSYSVRFPQYEAIRYLFNNAVVNLISAMSPETVAQGAASQCHGSELVRQCVKAYLAVCCALLILGNRYVTGYGRRAVQFRQVFEDRFPSLQREVPNLAKKIELSTSAKIAKEPLDPPSGFVEETVKDVCAVMRYSLEKYFDSSEQDDSKLILLLDKFPHDWLNSAYYFVRYVTELGRCPPPSCLFTEPIVNVYVSSACVLLGVRDRDPSKYLTEAKRRMAKIFSPLSFSGASWADWNEVRRICVLLHPQMLIVPQMRYSQDPQW